MSTLVAYHQRIRVLEINSRREIMLKSLETSESVLEKEGVSRRSPFVIVVALGGGDWVSAPGSERAPTF